MTTNQLTNLINKPISVPLKAGGTIDGVLYGILLSNDILKHITIILPIGSLKIIPVEEIDYKDE